MARSGALQIAVARLAADRTGAADEALYERMMLLGRELNQAENFAAAEDAYRQALAVRVAALGNDRDPSLATPIMHIALNLSNQGRVQEAERLFARAEALLPGAPDRTAAPRLAQYRAMHALNRGDLAAAEAGFATAEAGFGALVPAGVRAGTPAGGLLPELLEPQAQNAVLGLAESIRYRGVIASRRGDDAASREGVRRSAAVLRAAGLAPATLEGRRLRTEGALLTRAGQSLPAAQLLTQASARLAATLPGERPVASTLFLAGREWVAAGRTEEALAAFRQGATLLRERQIGVAVADLIPYLDALDARARAQPAEAPALRAEAFAAAQLARRNETARFLAQASARLAAADGNEAVAAAVRRREDADIQLRALLTERDALLATGRPAGALDQRIAAQRAAREEAEAEALAAAPGFRQLRDEAVSAEAALAVLGQGEAMVQFLLGPRHSYALALRPGRPAALARLSLTVAEAGRLVAATRAAVDGEGPQGGRLPAFDTAAAAALHAALLGPLDAYLEGAATLVVVPDGPLLALPFAMLLTGPADPANLSAAPWLIRRHAIVHAPSVQALVRLREASPASAAPRPYIGFGDFLPPAEAQLRASFPAATCGEDAAVARGLGRLPGTLGEVRVAASIMGAGATQVLGRDFTAAAVAGAGLSQYRIVHFATHGLLPGDLACLTEPAVMVSNPPGAADAAGSFVPASAIMGLRMDADLAILSACNTAGAGTVEGTAQAAEALSGLARAFFVAGARGLLATHWLASDAAAQFIVPVMLSAQNQGTPSAAALRAAQLALLTDQPGRPSLAHPFYWAPFALLGDGRRGGPTRTTQGAPLAAGGSFPPRPSRNRLVAAAFFPRARHRRAQDQGRVGPSGRICQCQSVPS
ncbi:CHAT domain-containing protein [Roseococcus microcysteis]|uniref:CHAT domain-containing protein n=1 Tax=Roseococcus microcysteis TaxID=2771361 RepID=UPI00168A5197|nr:CHAT domain-containing tetratricopeptide repeat protein [Roseococcus microcysteis]